MLQAQLVFICLHGEMLS